MVKLPHVLNHSEDGRKAASIVQVRQTRDLYEIGKGGRRKGRNG
jgi:hypothetical protein